MAAMVQKMRAGKTLGTTQPPSNNRPPTSTSTPEDQAGTSTENRQGNEEPERGGILKSIHALRKQHPGMSGKTKLVMNAAQV
jgi:hypothetical protein